MTFWMKRTLEEVAELRSNPTEDTVHDLRVALRRCRSVASTMAEIDPHPDWEEMRDGARELFRSLGKLRDTEVMEEWLKELHAEEDLRKRLALISLAATEETVRKKALHSAGRFDTKRWSELMHSLQSRMRLVPIDGDAAHCLALERLEEAKELHRRAMRTEKDRPWHALRIGVKRFRYTVEALMPEAHAECGDSLKRVQDVLGNIHDLDVLAELLKTVPEQQAAGSGYDWAERIDRERHENLQTYRQLALGNVSVWHLWEKGFRRESWQKYAKARIGATRKAMDPKPARSLAITRIALGLWSQFRTTAVDGRFSDRTGRRVLEAAAKLSGIHAPGRQSTREKSARTFLLEAPVPPGWSFAEWERAAWTIRFQRGAEPGSRNKRFSKLSAEQQSEILFLSGILRLAAALQKSGVTSGSSLRVETLPQGLLLRLVGVEDSPGNAARFAEAKKLLERNLGKTLLVQPDTVLAKITKEESKIASPQPISIVRSS